MKVKKKRLGTKAKIRAGKEREKRIATAIFLAFILLIVAVSGYYTYTFLNQSPNPTINPESSQLKAAIVDQGSLSPAAGPNPVFIETATNILKQANYSVDYYPGEEVSVEFYRNLPTHGYSLIILRVHSSVMYAYEDFRLSGIYLFSSEPYSTTRYVTEQWNDQIGIARYFEGGDSYFGISHLFVEQRMNGKFQNTMIIMMGCHGFADTMMAEAFVKKGAKVYISWDGSILGSRNDPAITRLLQHLITEKQTVEKAVAGTMKEFEPSPLDDSILLYYPPEARDLTIVDIMNNH